MDIVEHPSQTTFSSQCADTAVIDSPSPSVALLYNGLRVTDMSVADSVSKIRSFVHSSSQIAAARNLRGKDAQELIDLIDQVRS